MGLMLFFFKGPLSQQYFQSRFLINHIRKCVCLPKNDIFALGKNEFLENKNGYITGIHLVLPKFDFSHFQIYLC